MTSPRGPVDPSESPSEKCARLERRLERERAARGEAERLLETKSLELYSANVELQKFAATLEARIEERANEIREMQARLHLAQKMEAIGLLAGGVAHDFNNLLMIIGGASELLSAARGTGESEELLNELRDAVTRGQDLTRRLLAFSRQDSTDVVDEVDVAMAVRSAEPLLRRLATERVTIRFESAGGHWARVSRVGLDQILLNLAANARDAMPDGGEVRIRTSERFVDEVEAHGWQIRCGHYVVLEVSDTGIGMAPTVVERAFDPFFSTKSVGVGSGLGLATVYSIVRQAGGHIAIESIPNRGSLVRILLPRGIRQVVVTPSAGMTVQKSKGTGLIMVVDDEPAVRRVTATLLERNGYQVTTAADGAEALDWLSKMSTCPALMITDVRMPGMNGFELAVAVRTSWPHVPVLLVSGYVDDDRVRSQIAAEGMCLLEKPVKPALLLEQIQLLIEAHRNRSDAQPGHVS